MDIFIHNKSFTLIDTVEDYLSFIFTERYSEHGDFELKLKVDHPAVKSMVLENYLSMSESSEYMLIEEKNIVKNETEEYVLFTGRTLTAIMEWRVIRSDFNNPPNVSALLTAHIETELVEGNNYTHPNKFIPGLVLAKPLPSVLANKTTYQYSFRGYTLYKAVKEAADESEVGLKIEVDPVDYHFTVRLYVGADRTGKHATNRPAIFSMDLDNLKNINYVESRKLYANLAIVDLQPNEFLGENYDVRLTGLRYGMNLREMYVNGSDISVDLPAATKKTMSTALGVQELRRAQNIQVIDGTIDPLAYPTYGVNYFLGDIVALQSDYTADQEYRVTEYIRSYSASGHEAYPTLTKLITED